MAQVMFTAMKRGNTGKALNKKSHGPRLDSSEKWSGRPAGVRWALALAPLWPPEVVSGPGEAFRGFVAVEPNGKAEKMGGITAGVIVTNRHSSHIGFHQMGRPVSRPDCV